MLADGARARAGDLSGYLPTQVVVLAIGHSARDTYEMLFRRGVPMVPKPFQIGLRIEQPQEQVNRVQYGARGWKKSSARPITAWWLAARDNLFTFCMCAGGYIMPSVSRAGLFLHQRHEPVAARFALCQQRADGHARARAVRLRAMPLAGMMLQRQLRTAGLRDRPPAST